MIPKYLKEGDEVYFIPYTTDKPQIKLGHITEDFTGHRFIAYDYKYADDGQWYICEKKDIDKPEIKIKIFNLLQKLARQKMSGIDVTSILSYAKILNTKST